MSIKPLPITFFIALIPLVLTACTSTELVSSRTKKGNKIETTVGDITSINVSNRVEVTLSKVKITRVENLKIEEINSFQKIKSDQYKEVTDGGIFPTKLLFTAVTLPMDIITLGAANITGKIWNGKKRWYTEDSVVSNESIKERDFKYESKASPIENKNITLFFNKTPVANITTNKDGYATYNFHELLVESKIPPSSLIHDKGVTITAKAGKTKTSIDVENQEIPEEYFYKKYYELLPDLEMNRKRLENCNVISKNKRETFECYYQ
jgi:hypothetical protein